MHLESESSRRRIRETKGNLGYGYFLRFLLNYCLIFTQSTLLLGATHSRGLHKGCLLCERNGSRVQHKQSVPIIAADLEVFYAFQIATDDTESIYENGSGQESLTKQRGPQHGMALQYTRE